MIRVWSLIFTLLFMFFLIISMFSHLIHFLVQFLMLPNLEQWWIEGEKVRCTYMIRERWRQYEENRRFELSWGREWFWIQGAWLVYEEAQCNRQLLAIICNIDKFESSTVCLMDIGLFSIQCNYCQAYVLIIELSFKSSSTYHFISCVSTTTKLFCMIFLFHRWSSWSIQHWQ